MIFSCYGFAPDFGIFMPRAKSTFGVDRSFCIANTIRQITAPTKMISTQYGGFHFAGAGVDTTCTG